MRTVRPLAAALMLCFALLGCTQKAGNGEQAAARADSPPGARIVGTATLADNSDGGGIQVYIPGTRLFGLSDAQGGFAIEDVPPGVYKVVAQMAGYNSEVMQEALTVSAADAGKDVSLEPVELSPRQAAPRPTPAAGNELGSIEGKILTAEAAADGTPINPADILVSLDGTPYRTTCLPDGTFLLWNIPADQYRVTIAARGVEPVFREARVLPGEKLVLDPIAIQASAEQQPSAKLTGQVTLYDSQGQLSNEFNLITVRLLGTPNSAALAPDGTFAFENLDPRRYIVTASGAGFTLTAPAQVDLSTSTLGQAALTLVATAPAPSEQGRVTGFAIKGDVDSSQQSGILIALAGSSLTAMTDALGQYSLSNVPPGTYQLLATAEGYQKQEAGPITVTAGQEAQVDGIYLERNREAPRVLDTAPRDGTRDVIIRREIPIMIRFNHKMVPESLRAAVSIKPDVAYSVFAGKEQPDTDFDLMKIVLHGTDAAPAAAFNTRYTVTIDEKASDFEGVAMEKPYAFSLQTGQPAVIATLPAAGETKSGLGPRNPIVIYFNAHMDRATLKAEVLRIRPATNAIPTLTSFDDPATGWTNMQISATWAPDTEYTITIQSRARTDSKVPLMNTPYTFKFRTAKLVPLYADPAKNARRRAQ